jgi:VIT1/CCC1 family predicted Fe2+/Mn2+ transporter
MTDHIDIQLYTDPFVKGSLKDKKKIDNDLSPTAKEHISLLEYRELLADIQRRRATLDEHNEIKESEEISLEMENAGLEDISLVASLLLYAQSLFSIFQLKRKKTWDEKIILGLLVLGIILTILSFIFGAHIAIAAVFATIGIITIFKAAVSLSLAFKMRHTTQKRLDAELKETNDLKAWMDDLIKKIKPGKLSPEDLKDQQVKGSYLRDAVDEYIIHAYRLRQCEQLLLQNAHFKFRLFNGGLALLGGILLIFPPTFVVGSIIISASGVIATLKTIHTIKTHMNKNQGISFADQQYIWAGNAPRTLHEERYKQLWEQMRTKKEPETALVRRDPLGASTRDLYNEYQAGDPSSHVIQKSPLATHPKPASEEKGDDDRDREAPKFDDHP